MYFGGDVNCQTKKRTNLLCSFQLRSFLHRQIARDCSNGFAEIGTGKICVEIRGSTLYFFAT
jgi:hypothetical protein